jgi:hypothetical protein
MIEKADAAILKHVTRFCHWFQRWTGKTNFFLAKFPLGLCFAGCAIEILNYYRPVLTEKTALLSVVFNFAITIYLTVCMVELDVNERQLPSAGSQRRLRLGILYTPFLRIFYIGCDVCRRMLCSIRGGLLHPVVERILTLFSFERSPFLGSGVVLG